MMGIPRDHTTPYTKLDECHECGEPIVRGIKAGNKESIQYLKVFDDPWATKACHVVLHDDNDEDGNGSCLEKLFDTSWSDFRYFHCDECGRVIVRQCLDNGWRSFVKERNGAEICVKCYQDEILREGHDIDELQDRVPGEFFVNEEISAFGWSLVPGCEGVHVSGRESVNAILLKARALKMQGRKVLFNIDSMAYGGGEGYVDLYVKGA